MPNAIPYARLQAEAHAFPLASEAAFRHRVTELSRHAAGVLDSGTTDRLAREFESDVRPHTGGMSIEVLRQLRDAAWFPHDRKQITLGEHLGRIAGLYLERGGRRVRLRSDGNPGEHAECWRWLAFYLPSDLLIAALAAYSPGTGGEPADGAVMLVSPRLTKLLQEPCAETHLHVGASVPFALLWGAHMRDLAGKSESVSTRGTEKWPFGDEQAFRSMRLAAAVGRLLLASFLWQRQETGRPSTFRSFVEEQLQHIAARARWGLGEHAASQLLLRTLGHLRDGIERTSAHPARARTYRDRERAYQTERTHRLYQALVGRCPRAWADGAPLSIDEVMRADPLADWLPPGNGCALPEARFAYWAMRYLGAEGRDDAAFAGVFWQYQRVRCLTHRFLVEEPGTAGLDWFTRYYARISMLRGRLSRLTYATALHAQSRDLHLGALEARTSPEQHWSMVRDEVHNLASQAAYYEPRPAEARPEVGLVLHFLKRWERTLPNRGKRLHADPRQAAFGCRFGSWFHERQREAIAIATALRHQPELLLVLRGIDVASVELAEPTWPLVPLFAAVRSASLQASHRLARRQPSWQVPPLRVTVHAGEDFRRLVEGLRRIHELIEFGIVHVGDRIGHGLVLGMDPESWCAATRTVVQPIEDRLDDLIWELGRYQRGDINVNSGRLERVRTDAVRLGQEIYQTSLGPDDLVEARRLRHDLGALSWLGYPFIRRRDVRSLPGELFYRHLTDAAVFERGQRPLEVTTDEQELEMLRAVQRWLRRELGRREITVESNPSSNLVIADYATLEDHPVFRMQPLPWMREPEGGSVLVSVNTDNPITFASSLADEFAYLYFALLRRGVSADDALSWLDRARNNGFQSRFTLRASMERTILWQLLPPRLRAALERALRGTVRAIWT